MAAHCKAGTRSRGSSSRTQPKARATATKPSARKAIVAAAASIALANAGRTGFHSRRSAQRKAQVAQAMVSSPLVAQTAATGRLATKPPHAKACTADRRKRRAARRVAAKHSHAPAPSEVSSAGDSGRMPAACHAALHRTHRRFVYPSTGGVSPGL
jgi:hypothetical protein